MLVFICTLLAGVLIDNGYVITHLVSLLVPCTDTYRGTESSDCSSLVPGGNSVPLSEDNTNRCPDLQGVWYQVQPSGDSITSLLMSPGSPQEIRTASGLRQRRWWQTGLTTPSIASYCCSIATVYFNTQLCMY